VRSDADEELAGQAADDVLLAVHVGSAEAAGDHAADVPRGFEQERAHARPCRRDRGDHAARRRPVDGNVEGSDDHPSRGPARMKSR
jgi:hypothetical protein